MSDNGELNSQRVSVLSRQRVIGVGAILVLVFVGISLLVVLLPEPTKDADARPELVGSPTGGSLQEFNQEVADAVEALHEAGAIQGRQVTLIEDQLAAEVLFDMRPDGDFVVVQRVDEHLLLRAEGVELLPGPSRTTTTVWVRVEEVIYQAEMRNGQAGEWITLETGNDTTEAFVIGLAVLTDRTSMLGLVSNRDPHVTSQRTIDGGAVWALSWPNNGTSDVTLRWWIHPQGHLGFLEIFASSRSESPHWIQDPGSVFIEYRPVVDPQSIRSPDPGTSFDLSQVDLPNGFTLDG